ncbi:MAG: hypothetical protein OEZ43_01705 [Gammaproteobacteria bacterium]|nr:hypothetical protein [Gammaproteobacteria bacterium]
MASQQTRNLTIKNDSGKQCSGQMHYTAFTSADRTKRAVLSLLACWLIAGVTLFIPIAHFFLVPAFLIAGPVLFFLRIKQDDAKEKAEGTCPNCDQAITVALENTDKLPKRTYCPSCDKAIEIVASD